MLIAACPTCIGFPDTYDGEYGHLPAALDIAIALTALQFNKHDRKAAALLVPYLAWCAFAPTCM